MSAHKFKTHFGKIVAAAVLVMHLNGSAHITSTNFASELSEIERDFLWREKTETGKSLLLVLVAMMMMNILSSHL